LVEAGAVLALFVDWKARPFASIVETPRPISKVVFNLFLRFFGVEICGPRQLPNRGLGIEIGPTPDLARKRRALLITDLSLSVKVSGGGLCPANASSRGWQFCLPGISCLV
jgi:hypothetical protein